MPGRPDNTNIRSTEYAFAFVVVVAMVLCWWMTPEDTRGLLNNTIKLGVAVLSISIPVAAMLTWCLTRYRIPGQGFWESCLLVLLFMPLYIQLASWEAGFGRGGWYSTIIAKTLTDPPLEGFRGSVLVHAIAAVPWLFWIFRLGFVAMPKTWEEAASLDATPWQVFTKITLPLALPVFLAGVLYVMIVCATEITVTDRYQFRSYAEVIYNEFVLNGPDDFGALPLSVAPILGLMLGVLLCGLAVCRLILPRMTHATLSPRSTAGPRDTRATLFVIGLVCLLLFLPVGNLFYQAGIEVRAEGDGRSRVWSLAKCLQLIGQSPIRYRTELAWTAILAQLSVLGSICIAVVAACWARGVRWRQWLNALLATVCFVTPGPFLGLGIIWALNRSSPALLGWLYGDTIFAPWLAMTIRCLPFAYLLIWFGMKSIPSTLYEAAESDGANWFDNLRFITLPMLWPNLICAVFVCLAVAVGELCASVMVVPPGVTTVATEIFNLIHYGAEDQLAGLCLACLTIMVFITFLARSALRRLIV